MSENDPIRVPVNIGEAIDHDKPLADELRRVLRLVKLVSTALEAAGVELVTSTRWQDSEGASEPSDANFDAVPVDEAASLMAYSRHDELNRLRARLLDPMDEFDTPAPDPDLYIGKMTLRLMGYIEMRQKAINDLALRNPYE